MDRAATRLGRALPPGDPSAPSSVVIEQDDLRGRSWYDYEAKGGEPFRRPCAGHDTGRGSFARAGWVNKRLRRFTSSAHWRQGFPSAGTTRDRVEVLRLIAAGRTNPKSPAAGAQRTHRRPPHHKHLRQDRRPRQSGRDCVRYTSPPDRRLTRNYAVYATSRPKDTRFLRCVPACQRAKLHSAGDRRARQRKPSGWRPPVSQP